MNTPNASAEHEYLATCDYCGEIESDDVEIITKRGGDESMSICDSCYEHMFS